MAGGADTVGGVAGRRFRDSALKGEQPRVGTAVLQVPAILPETPSNLPNIGDVRKRANALPSKPVTAPQPGADPAASVCRIAAGHIGNQGGRAPRETTGTGSTGRDQEKAWS